MPKTTGGFLPRKSLQRLIFWLRQDTTVTANERPYGHVVADVLEIWEL